MKQSLKNLHEASRRNIKLILRRIFRRELHGEVLEGTPADISGGISEVIPKEIPGGIPEITVVGTFDTVISYSDLRWTF